MIYHAHNARTHVTYQFTNVMQMIVI